MTWEIDIIKWLQSGDVPFVDYLVYVITQFGTELFFMLAVMILYWCIDKREGFKLLNVFMIAQIAVGVIKTTVKRVRPYYRDGIEPILEKTEGYSFPSGHSNNIAVIGTDVTLLSQKKGRYFKTVCIISCIMIALVMFSRVYLGQHFPTDVVVGALLGVGVGILGFWFFDKLGDREERLMFIIVPLCVICFIVCIVFYCAVGEQIDSLMTVAGAYSAAVIGYYIEKKRVGYVVRSTKKWHYVVKMLIGIVGAIALKEGLKVVFALVDDGVWALVLRFVRYFAIGVFATLLAPMIFKKLKI